jgi:uncharacterized protein GlcG (DUF336 family)
MSKSSLFIKVVGIIVLTGIISISKAQLIDKKTLSLELAKKVAAVAESEAEKDNLGMVISVVDDSGNLIYLARMDGAQLGSIEISVEKAKTSVLFKRPTKEYEDKIVSGNNAILSLKNVLPFEGGIPLIVNNYIIGAIGVSGGNPKQDGSVAKTAADYFHSIKF